MSNLTERLQDLSSRLRDSGKYSADSADIADATLVDDVTLTMAGLEEGLEIATGERNNLQLACREFVRMQKELCDLLNESDEGDSIALHDRIVWAIKALREQIPEQGRSAADCRAHNPEVVGSNPTPASNSSNQPGCSGE